jgi:hypothetical protein
MPKQDPKEQLDTLRAWLLQNGEAVVLTQQACSEVVSIREGNSLS